MHKVLMLVFALSGCIGLIGCGDGTNQPVFGDFDLPGNIVQRTRVVYDPNETDEVGLPQIPLVTDLLLQGFAGIDGDCNAEGQCLDGTISFPLGDAELLTEDGPNPNYNPIFAAVGDLDGFSTTAAVDIVFEGLINPNSIETVGPSANVLLVPLQYTNDPVVGGGVGSDIPPILSSEPYGQPAPIVASVIAYSDVGQTETNTLRIVPKSPLKPATQYLVIITDGLRDINGIGVGPSVTYNFAASAIGDIADPALDSLRNAIQSWVKLATGFTNTVLGQNNAVGNIAYATTFTTVGTTAVLEAMTAPAKALNNSQLTSTLDIAARYKAEEGIVNGESDSEIVERLCTSTDIDCVNDEELRLSLFKQVKLARHLPQPAPRVSRFSRRILMPEDSRILIYDGEIKLPYYLSSPTGMDEALTEEGQAELTATAARVLTSIWRADDTLASDLSDDTLTPPSANVTRHYPFAKTGEHTTDENGGYIEAPISVFVDAIAALTPSTTCPDGFRPIIYQHGITGNRRNAVPFMSNIIDNARSSRPSCDAVIAIDLPLHGLDGEDQDLLFRLYTSFENLLTGIPVGLFAQRHFGLYQSESGLPAAMFLSEELKNIIPPRFDIAEKASGSLFINLVNFQGSRDNVRQAVMDALNLNASLPFLNFSVLRSGPDLDMSQGVSYVGHSLGGIVGTNFLALVNSLSQFNPYLNVVEAGVLANPGGKITKLLENSIVYSDRVLSGFKALGERANLDLGEGSSLLELTIHFFQATLDSSDPINFGDLLASTSGTGGVLMYEVTGDGTASNPPDIVVPPAAYEPLGTPPRVILDDITTGNLENNDDADTGASPLAGTTPLAIAANLQQISTTTSAKEGEKLHAIVRLITGSHGSFSSPNADSDRSVFDELMFQTTSFINSSGSTVEIFNDSIVKKSVP